MNGISQTPFVLVFIWNFDDMLFQEKQKFTQPLLWLVLFMLVCIPVIGLFKQVYLGEAFGTNPMSNSGLVVFSICMIALALIFVLIELRTTIDNNGISFQFFPFVKNSHSWSVIASAEVINYGFVGGWGVRWVNKYGTVYSVSGNKGVQIKLKNGKSFIIGTQQEEEMKKVLANRKRAN